MGEPTKQYRFIKDLVLAHVHRARGRVNYEQLTAEVKSQFPESHWQQTHWAWYRYQITRGRFGSLFSDEEKRNLKRRSMAPSPGRFSTIKELVFDYVHRTGGQVDYDALTAEVKRHFPASRWQKSHWAWYRCQMTRGRFVNLFSDDEKRNLGAKVQRPAPLSSYSARTSQGSGAVVRGPRAKDDKVKSLGDPILDHIRFVIGLAAGEDQVLRFKINRWIFARLLQDEIRVKRPIKKALWDSGQTRCRICGKDFQSLKGVEIHRKDGTKGYSKDNCLLACRECHQQHPDFA